MILLTSSRFGRFHIESQLDGIRHQPLALGVIRWNSQFTHSFLQPDEDSLMRHAITKIFTECGDELQQAPPIMHQQQNCEWDLTFVQNGTVLPDALRRPHV